MIIPDLSSPAGAALTHENWLEIGVTTVSCTLSTLLMKPGFETLSRIGTLQDFVGWSGLLILNVSDLSFDVVGQTKIRSIYDGSVTAYQKEDLLELIEQLKPDEVLWHCDSEQYSQKPMIDAMSGLIYSKERIYSILSETMTQSFEVLSAECECPTCSQGLTRAYLHHLYQQTPLLAYRYLIQHNVFSKRF